MNKTRTVPAGIVALAAAAAIAGCGNSATREGASSVAPTSTPASTQTSASAQSAAHNQADMNFVRMMIPHHQQAVEMSDIILAKQGIDPRVVDLATQIKAAQGPEIEKMQGWLNQWGAAMSSMPSMSGMPGMDHGGMHGSGPESGSATTTTPTPSGSTMPGMGGMGDMGDMPGMSGMEGMMSPAQMDALKNAQGAEASRLFLSGMIAHHQGALTMARDEIKNGQSPDAITLAKSILDSQQKEIDTMNQILDSL